MKILNEITSLIYEIEYLEEISLLNKGKVYGRKILTGLQQTLTQPVRSVKNGVPPETVAKIATNIAGSRAIGLPVTLDFGGLSRLAEDPLTHFRLKKNKKVTPISIVAGVGRTLNDGLGSGAAGASIEALKHSARIAKMERIARNKPINQAVKKRREEEIQSMMAANLA